MVSIILMVTLGSRFGQPQREVILISQLAFSPGTATITRNPIFEVHLLFLSY